eukprot:SAG31_NODE_6039_length_2197_cov_1.136320_1_plen_211_part_00
MNHYELKILSHTSKHVVLRLTHRALIHVCSIPNGAYLTSVKYNNIPDCFWWVVVTITTVGYGDLFPITWYGRYVGIATMLTGVFFIAMPLTIVGTSFNAAWEELEHSRHEAEEEENKHVQKKAHVALAKHANEFSAALNKFADKFAAGATQEDKRKVCEEEFAELREIQSNLTVELTNVFETFKLGIMDLNMVKELDALKTEYEENEKKD